MWRPSPGRSVTIVDHHGDAGRWAESRARFWTEMREGEREAEAQRARRHPGSLPAGPG